LNTSSDIYCPYVPFPLKIAYSIHMPISSLEYWFFGGWVFWTPCWFWFLVPYQMYSWKRFSPI
jgi:hypothetical protein